MQMILRQRDFTFVRGGKVEATLRVEFLLFCVLPNPKWLCWQLFRLPAGISGGFRTFQAGVPPAQDPSEFRILFLGSGNRWPPFAAFPKNSLCAESSSRGRFAKGRARGILLTALNEPPYCRNDAKILLSAVRPGVTGTLRQPNPAAF